MVSDSPPPENHAGCKIMWKSMVHSDRTQMTIQYGALRIRNMCCCPKAAMVNWARLNVTLYVQCTSCYSSGGVFTARYELMDYISFQFLSLKQ